MSSIFDIVFCRILLCFAVFFVQFFLFLFLFLALVKLDTDFCQKEGLEVYACCVVVSLCCDVLCVE